MQPDKREHRCKTWAAPATVNREERAQQATVQSGWEGERGSDEPGYRPERKATHALWRRPGKQACIAAGVPARGAAGWRLALYPLIGWLSSAKLSPGA